MIKKPEDRKKCKQSGPSVNSDTDLDTAISVSDLLSRTISVLYGNDSLDTRVFENTSSAEALNMAESSPKPTNRDIMNLLKSMNGRLETVERKLGAVESIKKPLRKT